MVGRGWSFFYIHQWRTEHPGGRRGFLRYRVAPPSQLVGSKLLRFKKEKEGTIPLGDEPGGVGISHSECQHVITLTSGFSLLYLSGVFCICSAQRKSGIIREIE